MTHHEPARQAAQDASTPTTEPSATRRTFIRTTAVGAAGVASGGTAAVAGADDEDGLYALSLDLSNLPDLEGDAYYEGWAIFDGGAEKVSTGVFSKGQEYVFGVDRDLADAEKVAITIEPDDEPGGDPSGVVLLKGEVADGEADLSFPIDFSETSGSFILASPTAPDAGPEAGVWFLQKTDGGAEPALDVPELGDGWVYEGWGVTQGTPLTTGRFADPAGPTDSAPFSGPEDAPQLPGEDFVQDLPEAIEEPVDLGDGDSKIVVSVEPDIDGSDPVGPDPFQIKPLAVEVPEDAEPDTDLELPKNEGTLPSGTGTLHEDLAAARGEDDEYNAVAFDLSNLPDLDGAAYYEGWAIFDGGEEKVSTGVFSKGQEYVFGVDRDLADADKIAITIEPDDEPGGDPSGVVLLKGEVEDGEADLSFPIDISEASGSFILASPSAPDAGPEAGVWFLQKTDDGAEPALDVPELGDGWVYEGWGVTQGTPLTTGRFADPAGPTDSAPFSGPEDAPQLPGEDFVQDLPEAIEEPVDLADGDSKIVVSVEPDIDGTDPVGPDPFQIKPLQTEVPEDAEPETDLELEHHAGTTPSGMARTHEDVAAARDARDDGEQLTLDLSNLPDLDGAAYYEGWAIFDGGAEKVSTGVFESGGKHAFEVDRDLDEAEKIAITIEPDDDPGGEPSGVVILKGELSNAGVATLSFPIDLSDASGSYLLNTPTAADLVAGESGVWFLQKTDDGAEPGLDLPELGDGWVYEGWIVHEETPITTGRFDDPTSADDSAPYSGPYDGPAFPGEDLITNEPADHLLFPTDLTDGESSVVVSVEPDIDGTDPVGSDPFQIKPLKGEIPEDAEVGTNYELEKTDGPLPSGKASVGGEVSGALVDGHVVYDLNGDGSYRDVTGSGDVTTQDLQVFFDHQHREPWDSRTDLFDFTGNGDVGQPDVIDLFQEI